MTEFGCELTHIGYTDISDYFKDAYGFRPRGVYKEWWTEAELEAEYVKLSAVCKENMEEQALLQKEALVRFDKLLKRTIKLGAGDRKTAIRWLIEGEDLDINFGQDVDHFFWLHDLSWDAIEILKKELK